jgi:DNA-binding MarR family transcriptional regulator
LWRTFLQVQRVLDQVVDRQLTAAGLSRADYDLLAPLSEAPDEGTRARDLGRRIGWDRSRLAHQLRRMEQRGLITRHDCSTDARGTVIKVTAAGRKAVETVAPGHVDTVRRHFVDLLDPAEIDTVTTILERVRDHILDTTDLAVGSAARTDQE